jgi:hypothetical protein
VGGGNEKNGEEEGERRGREGGFEIGDWRFGEEGVA